MFLRVLSKGYWGCPSFQPLIISAHIENSDPMEICEACRRPRPWRWLILLDIKWTCFCPSMSCVCRYNSILRYTNINMYIYIYICIYVYIYIYIHLRRWGTKASRFFFWQVDADHLHLLAMHVIKKRDQNTDFDPFFSKKKQWVKCGSVGKEL